MTINMAELKKQMLKDMENQQKYKEKDFVRPIKMKNIRGIYNLLQTQNTFFILDTRDAKNFDELNIRKSVNVPVTSSEKLAISLSVIVDPKADYIIVSSYEKEAVDFEKKNSVDKDNFTSMVLSQLSKMETKAKNIFLIQGGFEGFAKKYPFLCVSFSKSGTSLVNASLNYPFEVVPNLLFMGDSKHGMSVQLLKDAGISRVINVSGEKFDYPKDIESITLDYKGTEEEPIPPIDEAVKFIDEGKKDQKTLIFCFDGKVKSCVLAAAYILKDAKAKDKKINSLYAWGLLEQCKPSLKITPNYFRQLTLYEQELFEGIKRENKEKKEKKEILEFEDKIIE